MSLKETSVLSVVKSLSLYKIKANAGLLISLIAIQLLAVLFSMSGVSTSGSSLVMIKNISGDIILIFTLTWVLITGITVAKNGFDMDFTFVANRFTSHLSSMVFLLTASLAAGVAATLCGMLLRVIIYFTHSNVVAGALEPPVLLAAILSTFLYGVLVSSIGYLACILTRGSRIFTLLLPVLFIGALFVPVGGNQTTLFLKAVYFFTAESSPALFFLKTLLVSALVFGGIIIFSSRLEVK